MEVRDSRPGVTAADEAEDEDDADPSEEGRVGVFGVGAGRGFGGAVGFSDRVKAVSQLVFDCRQIAK